MGRIDKAFESVPRKNFLPEEAKPFAHEDAPIQIGYGQTNSQPYTVKKMLQWLDPKPGDTILDVGSGSGWTTALLAHITGAGGRVIAVELVPELVEFGKQNCERLKMQNVEFHRARKTFGWPSEAPYQRILVSASADEVPEELIDQLAAPGRLVIPVKGSIWVIEKGTSGAVTTTEHPGFVFVPLLST